MSGKAKWNRENLKLIAHQYDSYTEFKKNEYGPYQAIHKLGLVDDLCAHMVRKFVWTKSGAALEARKFKSRTDFQNGARGAYLAAYKNKWLDEICSHMNTHIPSTIDDALAVAKGYKYPAQFRKNYPSLYSLIARSGGLKALCPHMVFRNNRGKPWTEREVCDEAKKYSTRNEFKQACPGAYNKAIQRGWIDRACQHMDLQLNSWTRESIAEEAIKYQRKIDFKHAAGGAYCAALRLGIIADVCAHMDVKFGWTTDALAAEAKKYTNKTQFRICSNGAYVAAHKRGIIEDICSHMDVGISGFKPSSPAFVYFLKIQRAGCEILHKVGITGNRVPDRARSLCANGDAEITIAGELYFDKGIDAKALEKHLHKKYEKYRVDTVRDILKSGFTEVFSVNIWELENLPA